MTGSARLTEIVDQADIEAFHDNAGRDEKTPGDSLGVQLDALHERHVMLLFSSIASMLDDGSVGLAWV